MTDIGNPYWRMISIVNALHIAGIPQGGVDEVFEALREYLTEKEIEAWHEQVKKINKIY